MARSFAYQISGDALTKPAKHAAEHAPFFADWTDADHDNHDLLCAEMSRLAYADNGVAQGALNNIGFSEVQFLPPNSRGTECFVASHPHKRLTVLAFRGTESDKFADLISDGEAFQSDYDGGSRVHNGFAKSYGVVKDAITGFLAGNEHPLIITGHSLGPALATLAAFDNIPAELITFGSPLVGNARFKELFNGKNIATVKRFVDCCDVVTRVPPEKFDRQNFFKLFSELGNFAGLHFALRLILEPPAEAAAIALGLAFHNIQDSFTHVVPAQYIDHDGSSAPEFSEAQKAQDQTFARTHYFHPPEASLEKLKMLFQSLHAPGNPREAVRGFFKALFDIPGNAPVLLRDLADHAPLNYVTAFSGRTGAVE